MYKIIAKWLFVFVSLQKFIIMGNYNIKSCEWRRCLFLPHTHSIQQCFLIDSFIAIALHALLVCKPLETVFQLFIYLLFKVTLLLGSSSISHFANKNPIKIHTLICWGCTLPYSSFYYRFFYKMKIISKQKKCTETP